ncbi:MAG TPA: Uma2 family endonuclease, partial [Polyangiaceae bacterium]
ELIDGELVEVEVPRAEHECLVALLTFYLVGWAETHGGGTTFGSGYKIRITNERGVMPDVQFFRAGREHRSQGRGLSQGQPDLAVEIVSPSSVRYDRVVKMNWYASIGVPEYWVVDPEARTLECLVLQDGRYSIADALEGDATFAPAGFPGLEIPLAKLWTAAEEARRDFE